jgi:hypothetical protein
MPGTPDQTKRSSNETPNPAIAETTRELTWALIEEVISDDEFAMLDSLLLSDSSARETYCGCMELHADLLQHFASSNSPLRSNATKTPVLGFLGGQPAENPAAEDAR